MKDEDEKGRATKASMSDLNVTNGRGGAGKREGKEAMGRVAHDGSKGR